MTLLRQPLCQLLCLWAVAMVPAIQAQTAGGGRAAQVITQAVTFEQQSSRVEAVGSAEAIRSVVLYPAVADRVTAVNFVPGQRIDKGQVLVELDSRRQQVAVERATIQLRDAQRTVARLQESRERGAIAQSVLDDAITARDLLQVQLAEAKTELEDRVVRAPFSGVVGLTDVEPGDRISQQTAITTIDDRSQLLINFNAPEDALPILQGNASVELSPWQAQGHSISAKIAELDSRIDSSNRSIRVRALLDNSSDSFRPGMSFRVRLQLAGESYAVVPEAALLWGATSAYVWLAEQGKAKRVDVQIKQRLSGRLLVAGALTTGDQLIVEGVQTLRDGQLVRAANQQSATQTEVAAQ
ncbi:efflux RND transporter periplasmic adaptor subunit [Rheinheimera nanhaiensis]|uniref:RND family efflux system membrane fusion protein n=1 Tax=Rheinheimera nanhaiensis E407-8 TaxID=562729 RepID=I1DYN7_9GAMM|nr:efflux RND transporter periplasmic adaptor subunit [Rheinheimera nanhaiensis]GAB59165.1 RND family efflux system membrane fusion protein [Rheinheimera nanhaiensis E407-8]